MNSNELLWVEIFLIISHNSPCTNEISSQYINIFYTTLFLAPKITHL